MGAFAEYVRRLRVERGDGGTPAFATHSDQLDHVDQDQREIEENDGPRAAEDGVDHTAHRAAYIDDTQLGDRGHQHGCHD